MRRWLLILLLLVVPFQMVWAAAAPYCAHETDTGSKKHFGHHEHRHHAGDTTASAADDNSPAPGAHHADCESCHLGCSAPIVVPAAAAGPQPLGVMLVFDDPCYASHIPSGPERPDRSRPTPAVRFGGAVGSGLLNA